MLSFVFILFILGLFVGSFLNVLIDRLPTGEQVFSGRSHCDKCKKNILWYDLIPVFSWVVLKGRCRFCSSPIPFRNTLVEIITGSVFVLNHLTIQQFNNCYIATLLHCYIAEVLLAVIFCSLIVTFFIDLKHQIIPDEMVVVGISAALVLDLINNSSFIIHNYLLAAIGASAFFLLLIAITKGRGMGFGDVKFAFFMGLFLGYPKIVNALYFAFLTGALISVILIVLKQKKFGQKIAFGPFLVLGTLFAYFINYNLLAFL